ncbi:MAG TPA: DUF58 domain-containing protein [Phycisphaerae bacterium]|jgi:uncharacterized protein (DUF58 family)|nr:DUF58 domain-containing protein [Phycisphaerae bacterium]
MPDQLFDPSFLKKLEMLTLVARQLFRGDTRGDRRSSVHGASVEFADFRPYVQGDDFRRIDWNAFAKFESLMLRLFVEEQELAVHVLLDCSASMDYGEPKGPSGANKFDYGRRIAAALAYMALASTDKVTFTPVAVEHETDTFLGVPSGTMRGKPGILRLMDQLRALKPAGQTDLNTSLSRFAMRTTRAGLVVVISDFLSETGYEEGIKRLRYGKHDVVMLQTLSPQEIKPELMGDVRLVDMETKAGVDVSANRHVMTAYAKRLAAFIGELQAFAHRAGASYVLANTGSSFEDLVLKQFRALGLAR